MLELTLLQKLASMSPKRQTLGLDQGTVRQFLQSDSLLGEAIRTADEIVASLTSQDREFLHLPEDEQITKLQEGFVNFYPPAAVNPYVALAAKGPWIITSCGAVVYDAGGYGMLGFGHHPSPITAAISPHQVMANIMTASLSQKKFVTALRREIGKSRPAPHPQPYSHFLCLNSGSEAMTMASRFADINAKNVLNRGRKRNVKFLALEGSFHGRTDRPAQFSHSCLTTYQKNLASFANQENLVVVRINDEQQLSEIFAQAEKDEVFFEAFYLEPVQGEGNPGKALTPQFYRLARKLTQEMGSLLIIDSIQAGLRAQGCLSILDYPGFEGAAAPDVEVFSKALNAGQFPLSVLAVTAKTAQLYVEGVYGNTMTSNPRALDVASAVLGQVTPALSANIREMGKALLAEFAKLQKEFPRIIDGVQGTGLLLSIQINEAYGNVSAYHSLEWKLRCKGLGVIHGGKNSLRFTPHFRINLAEIGLITSKLHDLFASI